MNEEDRRVPAAVEAVLPQIAEAVVRIADALRRGGRLIYVGAGTSGRLAVLDAAECPPTFGTPPDLVQAVLAGEAQAVTEAVEGAEDDEAAGARAMDARGAGPDDVVVGIAASGRTPFVIAAVRRARARGAAAAGVAEPEAVEALARAGGRAPVAIVMLRARLDPEAASERLVRAGGSVRRALAAP